MPIRILLPLLFILVPFAEIYLLIEVGRVIDTIPTIFLIVFTGVLGALLLRHQGLFTVRQMQKSMARGEMPALAMVEGVLLIFSGALLLTPGFLTDTAGLLLLIPQVRKLLVMRLVSRLVPVPPEVASGGGGHSAHISTDREGHTIIEGEYKREDGEERS